MGVPADWWQNFFSGPAVAAWLASPTKAMTEQETVFIEQALQVMAPAKLLDVPCGGGRHARMLAERGFHVTGVDISPEFLAAARAGADPARGRVAWEQREMRDLPWSQEFDGAYCFGNSFAYFDEAGNAAFLQAVARALKPGARFVLDTSYVAEVLFPILQERSWYPAGDLLWLSERRYDPADGRLSVDYTWIREAMIDKRSMSARIYTYRELVALFEAAGLTELQTQGSYTGEPFRLGSHRLLITGKRPA